MTAPRSSYGSAFLLALVPLIADTEELQQPSPLGKPASTVYRQITPDGRVVYSDKPVQGAKIDETITVEPPIEGNAWTTAPGTRPEIPPQTQPTPVNRVGAIPVPGKRKTIDEANAEVVRAEMLLEDARKRREAGVEPLPGERTGTVAGTSRLNDAYKARQQALAQAVSDAETALKKSVAERDALRAGR